MMIKCSSCGVNIIAKGNFVKFSCPNCGEVEIVRCLNCKTASNKYTCSKCGFVGP